MRTIPELTFVVTTYNRRPLLETELPRIKRLTEVGDVILIDDGSDDGTLSVINEFLKKAHRAILIRNDSNKGTAFCWNLGISSSKTEYIVLLHDDTLELLPSVDEFVQGVRASLQISDVVGVHVGENVRLRVPGEGLTRDLFSRFLYALAGQVISTNDNHLRYSPFVPGIMAMKREVGLSIRFDDRLLAGYGFREESDFQLRAKKHGLRILYNPTISVTHRLFHLGGQKNQFSRRGYAFWAVRNQLIFMRKNHLTAWPPRYAMFILYQIILHGARLVSTSSAMREGFMVTARTDSS